MSGSLAVSAELLTAFLLVLARVSGVVALAPLPGGSLFPVPAKIALSLVLAALLTPLAGVSGVPSGPWTLGLWVAREAGFGVGVGVALQFLAEMLGLAAQMLGFQAGYSYVNTIDPTSQVDATILNVLLTLLGGLLLFSLNLHLELVRALALSLERIPLGEFRPQLGTAERLVRLGAAVFEMAVRLAFPVIALLLMLDLVLALLSYVNARMQLLTLSFPVKMLVTMMSLSAVLAVAPRLYGRLARQALGAIFELAGR